MMHVPIIRVLLGPTLLAAALVLSGCAVKLDSYLRLAK